MTLENFLKKQQGTVKKVLYLDICAPLGYKSGKEKKVHLLIENSGKQTTKPHEWPFIQEFKTSIKHFKKWRQKPIHACFLSILIKYLILLSLGMSLTSMRLLLTEQF